MWHSGENIVLRGIYDHRAWYVQSAIVVKDSAQEIVLAILPGAECVAHRGYIHGRHGAGGEWDRWKVYMSGDSDLQTFAWRTNRVLVLLEPEKYYSAMLFWDHESGDFLCYYVNFQRPFTRNLLSIDTLDMDLDLVIHPDLSYEWKDTDEYHKAVERGAFLPEWIEGLEQSKPEVFERLEKRQYPFDGTWSNWMPDPAWPSARLPENWDKIGPAPE